MDHLLDTHTFIWFINGQAELSGRARKLIEQNDANNFVSIGSLWEIAIKISLNKLKMNVPMARLPEKIRNNGFEILPITADDTLQLSSLPFHHRDPFDRLLIAQSMTDRLTIITKDAQFTKYGIPTAW